MPEDKIAELLKVETKTKPEKKEQPRKLSAREKEFVVIEELVAEVKTLFLEDEEIKLETIFEEIKSRLDEIGKPEEDKQEEENSKKVDAILEAKGKTLSTIGNNKEE